MLYQIQWRFKDKPNKLVTEKQQSQKISKSFDIWVQETIKSNPPPEDAQVLIVNEKSEWFIRQ